MQTRHFNHLTVLFLLTGFLSCQKEIKVAEESQGTNFNRLLKTVSQNVDGADLDITTSYTYNTGGQITEIKRTFSSNAGVDRVQKDVYYRNAAGRPDSIVYVNVTSPQGGAFHNVKRTEFYYTAGGNIAYSVNRSAVSTYPEDSAVYFYQGSLISKRIVYRKPLGSPVPAATATFTYQHDAAGNVSSIDVVWSNPSVTKSCSFTYDDKPNPLPVMEYENELYGNWLKAFDNIFAGANNIISRRVQPGWDWDWGNKNYEYRYAPNNKTLWQKIKNADGPGYFEVFYYYD